MTPADRKEIAELLRNHARQLEEKGRPIFTAQIQCLRRQAEMLDPAPHDQGPALVRDTAQESTGPCIHVPERVVGVLVYPENNGPLDA